MTRTLDILEQYLVYTEIHHTLDVIWTEYLLQYAQHLHLRKETVVLAGVDMVPKLICVIVKRSATCAHPENMRALQVPEV